MHSFDPRRILASRLRALRESRWPGVKVTQAQLAEALGSGGKPVSGPLISSWESKTRPVIPPASRLEDYATVFASPRSFEGQRGRQLSLDEMTDEERAGRHELARELAQLRDHAAAAGPAAAGSADDAPETIKSLRSGPWYFADGRPITIVCAQVPAELLDRIPYTSPRDPDYIKMYHYADLDALFELHGHLRAANPTNHVNLQIARELRSDDYTDHLVVLGGVDWNQATYSVLDELRLPVKQVANWNTEEGAYFELTQEDGSKVPYRPILAESGDLKEDVALFAWAVNPYNQRRFVTICNGMYGSGSVGAVRALTDARFRDRNAEYVQQRFADCKAYCILTRVRVVKGVPLTPDWTLEDTRLAEWSRPL